MNEHALAGYFRMAAGVAAFLAVIWILRIRSRGARAVVMSLAFLCLGASALLLANGNQGLANFGLILVVLLLVAEFALRSKQRVEQEEQRP